jgi:hypothetical protein
LTVPDPVPASDNGAIVRSVRLELRHREGNAGDIQSQSVRLSGFGNGFRDVSCPLVAGSESVDSTGNFRNQPFECDLSGVREPYFRNPGGLTVTFDTQLKNGRGGRFDPERESDISLDSVRLTAERARPVYRASRESDQPIVDQDRGSTIKMGGTVYLPTGDVQLDFVDSPNSVFERGLIAQSVTVEGLPGPGDFTPFRLPGGGNYTDRLVTFQALVDGATTSPMLTARVRFCDVHPGVGAPSADCLSHGSDGGPPQIVAWDPRR